MNKYPNPTPRMVFGTAAAIFLITLTTLHPKWLILPVSVAILFAVIYAICWVVQTIVDNEWPGL